MPLSIQSSIKKHITNFTAVHRLLFCLALAVLFLITFYLKGIEIVTSIMIGWDVFGLLMTALCWFTFFTTSAEATCNLANREDESRTIIFIIVLVSVLISLFGILILLKSKDDNLITKGLHEPVSLIGVALSWFLLHSVFTLHYTHLYYGDDNKPGDPGIGGLEFPEEKRPDYRDFAYFSFVIGMTFQVSDVSITSRKIRRLVLLHSIISFLYNTIIVALTISIISNLK